MTVWTFCSTSKKNLESPSSKDALCQDCLKLAQWFWRRIFFNFVNVLSLFRNYFPLEKGRALNLNKLESPSPNDALCQVWLKLAQWFWRRSFFNFINLFLLFSNYLPLKKAGSFFWTNLNPLHPRMLCAKFGWNWLSGSGEEVENKYTDRPKDGRTDGRTNRQMTDDRRSEKLTWGFSSGELNEHCISYTFSGTFLSFLEHMK